MKRLTYILLFLAISTLAIAQEFTVKRFEATNDLTARDSRYLREDLNGNPCALVKVQVALTDVEFEGNKIGDVPYKTSEYWVYLPAGDKRLKIKHPNYLPLTVLFADYGIERLEGKTTYVLVLNTASTTSATQTLTVKYSPKDAMLLIDGQIKGDNGVAEIELPVGSHSFNVAKKGYIGQQGTITLAANAPGKLLIELDKENVVTNNKKEVSEPVAQKQKEENKTISQVAQSTKQNKPEEQQKETASISTTAEVHDKTFNNEPKTFTVNGVSFTMIPVEGGTFTMGATEEQAGFHEKPAHSVTLSSYMIGETEVTQGLWEAVMGKSIIQIVKERGSTETFGVGPNYPIYEISWHDCQQFIRKLNTLTGMSFRLPTEAEWEYASKGGNKSQGYKYSGSNNIDDVAVYEVNSYKKGSSSPDYGTHAVKTKRPNELGIYDMSGNVWEWCQDWSSYKYKKSSETNPTGPSKGTNRVYRGGSWFCNAASCRSVLRSGNWPGREQLDLGLRLAL